MPPRKLVLFAPNGDSISESTGSLWDLLANLGEADRAIDANKMTVAFIDGDSMKAMPLGPALEKELSPEDLQRTIDRLETRAASYTGLARWLRDLLEAPKPAEEVPAEQEAAA